jgi:mono/diheme cytochrome c family protein
MRRTSMRWWLRDQPAAPQWWVETDGRRAQLAWLAHSPVWCLACVGLCFFLVYPSVRALVLGVEVTPAQRGYRVALRSGCFNCHGPDGTGGVKNPGSKDGEVPGFSGGVPMMWVKSEQELREYILDGAPARKRADPKYRQQVEAQLLAMPAFHDFVSARDVDDVIVYLRAVSGLITPSDELSARGQELAYRLGCFHCHGAMGAGLSQNPGALKGYIPGWWGSDFRELVRNDDELQGWILRGEVPRLRDNPIAAHFIHRQRVYMPAYRGFVTDTELKALTRYVRWINAGGWQNQPLALGAP